MAMISIYPLVFCSTCGTVIYHLPSNGTSHLMNTICIKNVLNKNKPKENGPIDSFLVKKSVSEHWIKKVTTDAIAKVCFAFWNL